MNLAHLHLMGMEVIEHPNLPKFPRFTINPDLPMTDEGRAKAQDWCNRFFGMEHRIIMLGNKKALMHPELFAQFCGVIKDVEL